jgi:AraC-like DNA-binding protein
MSGSSTARFTDAEDYKSSLSEIFTEFLVTRPGAFLGRVHRTDLHHLHLLQAQESAARVAHVALRPDRVFVSFTADANAPLIWRGVTLEPDEIMLHARGERLHQRTVGPSRWGLIALSPAALVDFCLTETGGAPPLPVISQVIQPPPIPRKWLFRVHREAARLAETRPAIVAHPEVVRAMELELAGALARCLMEGTVRAAPAPTPRDAGVMERLESVLASSTRTDLTAAEIAAAVGVSGPTLRTYCRTILGVSPTRYLQLKRLAKAHAAILRADNRVARIAEFARTAGFEPDRFASLYKAAYGETPIATLRRSRKISSGSEIT